MPLNLNSDGSIPMWMDEAGRPHPVQSAVDALSGSHEHAEYAASDHAHAGGDHPDLTAHTGLGLAASGHLHNYASDSHSHFTGHVHSYASNTHTHAIGDTTNLQSSLDGKAASGHNHDAAYSASGHTHTLSDGDIPAAIARDAEVTAAIATHAATPHGGEGGFQFPVGALYLTTINENPGTTFGYGTWALFGVGRFLLGTDSQAGVEAGSATHSHTFTQPDAHTGVINHTHAVTITDPGHVHDEYRNGATTGGLDGWGAGDTSTNNPTLTGYDTGSKVTGISATTANPAGGVASLAHTGGAVADGSTNPPSITAFMWQRTA